MSIRTPLNAIFSSGSSDLLRDLSSIRELRQTMIDLHKYASERPEQLLRKLGDSRWDLETVLRDEEWLLSKLARSLKSRQFKFSAASKARLPHDEGRVVFRLNWPDRLVEGTLARLIADKVNPSLSDRLFSFKPGKSHLLPIREFSAYLQKSAEPVFILRRDIRSYGETISRDLLMHTLKALIGPQHEYIWGLLRQLTELSYLDAQGANARIEKGLAAGLSTTPLFENVMLHSVDRAFESTACFYSRYGDDILASFSTIEEALDARARIACLIQALKLEEHPRKSVDLALVHEASNSPCKTPFREVTSFDFLGCSLSRDGEIFISKKKERRLKNHLRRVATRAAIVHRKLGLRDRELAAAIAKSIAAHIHSPAAAAELCEMRQLATGGPRFHRFDRWLLKQPLREAFGSAHDRAFKRVPLKECRRWGLKSLLFELRQAGPPRVEEGR